MPPFSIKGLRVMAAVLIGTACGSLMAADRTAQDLNKLRVYLDRVNMDYQMFKGENANPRYADYFERDMGELEDARDALSGTDVGETYADVDQEVSRYLQQLEEGFERIASGGFEVPAVADEMLSTKSAAQANLTALYDARLSVTDQDPRIAEYHALSLMMQQMAAKYLEAAAASYGVSFGDHSDEKAIDQLAQEFSMALAQLDTQAEDLPPEVRAQLLDVKRKWGFIEQSMLNYLQDQVSFLIYRYSSAIVDDLLSAAKSLGGEDEVELDTLGPANIPLPPGIPAAQ